MQWLIDIVLEKIRQFGMFVDRGDPGAFDFEKADFTTDNTWRELDLSGIVPEHANAVLMTLTFGADNLAARVRFRNADNANVYNTSQARLQVVGVQHSSDLTCPIGADRKLEYRIPAAFYGSINLTVKGWWF